MDITEKIVLGTAQFGMDYGIANISGKPSKKEVLSILDLAWQRGIRRFDTAPDYGSEALLGEFISANGLQGDAKVMTKIPSLLGSSSYQLHLRTSLEASLNNLECQIDVLFFHEPLDSLWLIKDPQLFESLLQEYAISTLGVSVYDPEEVERMSASHFELAFQFPFNVLDRRFLTVNMPKGRRYARSVFLQGLLASPNDLPPDTPKELLNLQKEYHDKLDKHKLEPISFSISFASQNDDVDYFVVGVDSAEQLQDILTPDSYNKKDIAIFNELLVNTNEHWLDPRNWNLK